MFLTPPIAVVDEENHFFRALEVSEGNIYTDRLNDNGAYGDNLPENMVYYVYYNKGVALNLEAPDASTIKALGEQKPDYSKTREVVYNGSAAYSPVGYIPQGFGMLIAKSLGLANEMYLYLGRIFNLIAFIVITFFAIRLISIGKFILLTVGLLPTTLYQAASLSQDSLVMAGVFISFALAISLLAKKSIPSKKMIAAISLAITCVALTKYVYVLLIIPILLLWIIAVNRKARTRAAFIVAVILLLPSLFLTAWNLQLSAEVTSSASVLESSSKVISPESQLKFIFTQPLAYIESLANLFFFDPVSGDVIFKGIIGRYGWLGADRFASLVAVIIGFSAIYLSMMVDRQKRLKEESIFSSKNRIIYAGVLIISAIITILGITTALYLTFNSVGSSNILGVQGRYFIPIIPSVMTGLAFLNPLIVEKIRINRAIFLLYSILLFNIIYAAVVIAKVNY